MQIIVKKPTDEDLEESASWPVWEKEPSEFDWAYHDRERCLILEGSAVVEEEDGEKASFSVGDYVIFPAGLHCVWKIEKTLRKKYSFG